METRETIRPDNQTGNKFITLPGEALILLQRKHVITFLLPSLSVIFLGLFFTAIAVLAFLIISFNIGLFIASFLTIFVLVLTAISKLSIDWLFNFYVVTNRKIIEIRYAPLFMRETNEVLLDQVRCTEIDARIDGIVNEVFDIGDVILTFDRPTHQQELIFESIKDPKSVESYLESAILPQSGRMDGFNVLSPNQEIWFKKPNETKKWVYLPEVPSKKYEVN